MPTQFNSHNQILKCISECETLNKRRTLHASFANTVSNTINNIVVVALTDPGHTYRNNVCTHPMVSMVTIVTISIIAHQELCVDMS